MIRSFFLRDHYQIDKVIQFICLFSKASGLYLNINKCDLIAIHDSELDSLCNIPIKKSVKYLGITITRDSNQNIQKNLANNLLKAKNIQIEKSVKTPASWKAHALSTRPGIPSGPTALRMFTRLKDRVTSTTERESGLTSSAATAGVLSVWAVLSASNRA